ncbi:MAG: ribosome biogenesis GTPase Der [Thermacetogeniaceae bacterium]
MSSKPVVAIVGRPNVGKSTLFNRLVGRRKAVVADVPGVTRDRIYNDVEWNGKIFTLVDTGGLFLDDSEFRQEVHDQVYKAISEADVIILVVDGEVGPVPEDEEIARMLLKMRKKTIVVVNKVDDFRNSHVIYDFLVLGLGEPLPLSAIHGLNIDELLDRIVSLLPEKSCCEEEEGIHIAVVGRPNVGKSSLINALLKEKRLIVSDIPGTTRDAVDTVLKKDDRTYILVDTAGIRRKSRISDDVEYYGVQRSLRAIDRSDVVLFVLDATQGVVEQDTKIGGYIAEAGKGLIIIINKWDLVKKEQNTKNMYDQLIKWRLDFLGFAPLHYVSALTGQGVDRILPLVDRVYSEYTKRISTGSLNSWLMETVYLNPPPAVKGVEVKFYYAVQAEQRPPLFVFFVNRPEMVHFSYKRYLENQLRKAYGFEGTPIRLIFRKRE